MASLDLIILFGSQAAGRGGAMSDFDVAVSADHELSLAEKNEAVEMIARDFGFHEDKINLTDIADAHPLLQMEIATNSKLLRGTSEAFMRFRVLAWKRKCDYVYKRNLLSSRRIITENNGIYPCDVLHA